MFRKIIKCNKNYFHHLVLKKAFAMFDQGKTGFIETNRVAAILNTMGQQFDSTELQITIEETDKDSKIINRDC